MRIGVYCSDYRPEDGGASSLVGTILNEVREHPEDENEYLFLYAGSTHDPYKKNIDGLTYLNVNAGKWLSIDFLSKCSRILGVELCFRLDKIAAREQLDLIWFTAPFYTGIKVPFIFPVWDLGHKTTQYPEVSKGYVIRARDFMYEKMLARAKYVLTANETGKQEILQYYHIDADKIRLAPFPISAFCYGGSEPPQFDVPEQFFFYPAQFWPHKNHITVLKALDELRANDGLCPTMFFTGADHGSLSSIQEEVRRLNLQEQVHFTGFLRNEELKYLYEHATAMVFASMMGPNNLPPLEAAFLECPVIITNIPGHVEQMQDCATYFDGLDAKSLAAQMRAMLQDTQLRNSLVEKERLIKPSLEKIDYFKTVHALFEQYSGGAAL